jgi:hypothetical protein
MATALGSEEVEARGGDARRRLRYTPAPRVNGERRAEFDLTTVRRWPAAAPQ